jgi:hypothetical protein
LKDKTTKIALLTQNDPKIASALQNIAKEVGIKLENFIEKKDIQSLDDLLILLASEILYYASQDNPQMKLSAFAAFLQIRKIELEKERLQLQRERLNQPQRHIVEIETKKMPVINFTCFTGDEDDKN